MCRPVFVHVVCVWMRVGSILNLCVCVCPHAAIDNQNACFPSQGRAINLNLFAWPCSVYQAVVEHRLCCARSPAGRANEDAELPLTTLGGRGVDHHHTMCTCLCLDTCTQKDAHARWQTLTHTHMGFMQALVASSAWSCTNMWHAIHACASPAHVHI